MHFDSQGFAGFLFLFLVIKHFNHTMVYFETIIVKIQEKKKCLYYSVYSC